MTDPVYFGTTWGPEDSADPALVGAAVDIVLRAPDG